MGVGGGAWRVEGERRAERPVGSFHRQRTHAENGLGCEARTDTPGPERSGGPDPFEDGAINPVRRSARTRRGGVSAPVVPQAPPPPSHCPPALSPPLSTLH